MTLIDRARAFSPHLPVSSGRGPSRRLVDLKQIIKEKIRGKGILSARNYPVSRPFLSIDAIIAQVGLDPIADKQRIRRLLHQSQDFFRIGNGCVALSDDWAEEFARISRIPQIADDEWIARNNRLKNPEVLHAICVILSDHPNEYLGGSIIIEEMKRKGFLWSGKSIKNTLSDVKRKRAPFISYQTGWGSFISYFLQSRILELMRPELVFHERL